MYVTHVFSDEFLETQKFLSKRNCRNASFGGGPQRNSCLPLRYVFHMYSFNNLCGMSSNMSSHTHLCGMSCLTLRYVFQHVFLCGMSSNMSSFAVCLERLENERQPSMTKRTHDHARPPRATSSTTATRHVFIVNTRRVKLEKVTALEF